MDLDLFAFLSDVVYQ